MRGTEGAAPTGAFWSPDSRSIGFVAGGIVKKVDVEGGPAISIADLGANSTGTWNSDGVILVGSPRGIYRLSQGGGPAELITKTVPPKENSHTFPHFLPDGRRFLYSAGTMVYLDYRDAQGTFRLSVQPLDGTGKPIAYSQDRFNQAQGQFAPSGDTEAAGAPRWIAFTSNDTGDNEVYVQSFPPTSNKIRVSVGGGLEPRWRQDGKELFYLAPGGSVMAVNVVLAPEFKFEPAKELFKVPIASGGPRAFAFHYDVAPDGERFLVLVRPQAETAEDSPLTVVLNWQAAVKR